MDSENDRRMSPLTRRGLIAAAAIGIYALLGFFLAPWLIERTLVNTLADRANLETRIGALSLNPFALSLAADKLEIIDADGSELFAFERLYVNFELSSLFNWAWSFDEAHLIQPRLHFERFSDSATNFSALADRWAASAEPLEVPLEVPQDNPKTADSAAALPRLMVADLQIKDGHLAISDQLPEEAFSTTLSPINLALKDFSTLPDGDSEQQVTISTESGATVAWTGRLSVNPLAVSGRVNLTGTYTPLLFRYFQDQLALPISFEGGEIEATLNYQVDVDETGQFSVSLNDLAGTLSGLNITQSGQPNLAEVGTFSVSGGELAWPALKAHVDSIGFDEVLIQAYRYPHGGYFPESSVPATETETETEAEAVSEAQPSDVLQASDDPTDATTTTPSTSTTQGLNAVEEDAARWQLSVGSVELRNWRLLHTETALEDGVVEISNLDLTLRELSNVPEQQMPLDLNLSLGAGGSLGLSGKMQFLPELRLEATMTGSDLALATAQPYLNALADVGIAGGRISMNGTIRSNPDEPFRYDGDFHLRDLDLIDRTEEKSLLSWTALSIDRLNLTPAALELSVLTLDAPYARIEIGRDGSTNIERTFLPVEQESTEAPAPDTDENKQAPGFSLTIGETRISEGGAYYSDLALPLPFEARISALTGSLTTLASGSREPVHVDLSGQVNEYGQVQVKGDLSAFQPAAATDISVQFENVNVPSMTPYTIKFAGRKIDDGRMDLGLTYQLSAGALTGENHLVIRDLALGEKVEQPGAMDLPLDMAVALLKDPSGNLDFNFPVSGTLDDPDFSVSGAVSKAFSNVVLGLATAPFRLLGSLVGLKAEDMDGIGFEPGEAGLSPPQTEILHKLTEALAQRPQLVLEAAPVSNPEADRAALAATLVDAEISDRLAEDADSDVLMTERRRQILETLHDSAALEPAREQIEISHQQPTESGEPALDVAAYIADLREALVAAQAVSDADLNLLAERRLVAVQTALTELASLPVERLRALPFTETTLSDKGLVQMSLKVTIAD